MTVQKLKPTIDSEFEAAKRYYSVISALNNLELTNLELNLLAFIATKGGLSNTNTKEVFCQTFDSTINSVNNSVNRLKKKAVLVKTEGKVNIVPAIALNFKEPVIIKITLDAKTEQAGS